MRLINPVKITPSKLVSSNAQEENLPEWAEGAHEQSYRCIYERRIYEVLAESTTDSPRDGLLKHPPSWLDMGATNPWRMFDGSVGSVSEQLASIEVSLQPNEIINAVSMLNLKGREAIVELVDPVDGLVYRKEILLADAGSSNWYDYFFLPIPRRTDFVLLDLPAYGTATLSVSIDNAGDIAAVGHLVIGRQSEIGSALYGTSIGIIDYSRKVIDEWGNIEVMQRAFSKRAEFDVAVETAQVGRIQRLLASVRSMPVVWVGEDAYEATILFGYYRDFSISISGPSVSDATITVEGLT